MAAEDELYQEDPNHYHFEDLIHIDSHEKATRFVNRTLGYATTSQLEGIIKALYRVSGRHVERIMRDRIPPQKGGSRTEPLFYNFLALCESIHDFCDDDTDVERVIAALQVELPDEVPASILRNEKAVVSILSKKEKLRFGERVIPNSLFGAKILDSFDINEAMNNNPHMSLEDLYDMHQRTSANRPALIPIDIITPYQVSENANTYQVLKLQQIAHLIANMRIIYGRKREFQVDCTDKHLLMIVCALDYVSAALLSHFVTDPPFKTSGMCETT